MTTLSEQILGHIDAMFAASDVDEARRLLVSGCGRNLPGLASADLKQLERIQSAAVRLSAGRVHVLREAIRLAEVDWRDLLVAAGFADDPNAHARWQPRRLDAETLNRWYSGDSVDEVLFCLNDTVLVRIDPDNVQTGSVISLEGFEPEPRYLVELGEGSDVLIYQRHLELVA